MSAENSYYAPCPEFDRCNELIDRYYKTKQYEPCFIGHLALAEKGYPLAECQVGYFYLEGLGVEKNLERHSIGPSGQLFMETEMLSIIWAGSMRRGHLYRRIWNRPFIGISWPLNRDKRKLWTSCVFELSYSQMSAMMV